MSLQFVTSLEILRPTYPTLLTIGKFDGVHRAHQHLIRQLVDQAHTKQARSAVLTFDPHPDEILRPEREIRYLTTMEERAQLIEQLGVDLMIALPFTPALSLLSAAEFMQWLTQHIELHELWVGPDFRLGHRAQGTIEVLKQIGEELGYNVCPIELWTLDGEAVRSTTIRQLLTQGDVAAVQRYLGRAFSLEGFVIKGDQRGRTIGFPTANLALPPRHVVPANGVYACEVTICATDQRYAAVTNIGVRPTFGTLQRTIETHIFDFNSDLYEQKIQIAFIERLRAEQPFASREALIQQIHQDVQHAKVVLDKQSSI